MLDVKAGQIYVCTKSKVSWWTEGKEYEVIVNRWGELCLVDNDNDKWVINYLNNRKGIQFKLVKNPPEVTMKTLEVKEGQTYICQRDDLEEWTLGKEYKVVFYESLGLVIVDDEGDKWYLPNHSLLNDVFKLKENAFDLNTLTLEELEEYLQLAIALEEDKYLMNNFIERMSK